MVTTSSSPGAMSSCLVLEARGCGPTVAPVPELRTRTVHHCFLLAKLDAEPDRRSVGDVFGAQPVPGSGPDDASAGRSRDQGPGRRPAREWVTWKVYDRSRRQLASVVARDLRTGRIAAVRRSGLHIDSRVTPTADGRFVVEIARTAENAS